MTKNKTVGQPRNIKRDKLLLKLLKKQISRPLTLAEITMELVKAGHNPISNGVLSRIIKRLKAEREKSPN